MLEFFRQLFSTDFMPHVYCLREPALIALHTISDGLIALAYFLIPVALIILFRRRRDLAFRWAYFLFAIFILACGTGHILGIVTLWHPVYRLEGLVKALTAFASVATAIVSTIVFAADLALVIFGRHKLKQQHTVNVTLSFGNGVWMVLVSMLFTWIALILLSARVCGCCGLRR